MHKYCRSCIENTLDNYKYHLPEKEKETIIIDILSKCLKCKSHNLTTKELNTLYTILGYPDSNLFETSPLVSKSEI